MLKNHEKLQKIIDLGAEICQIHDVDMLLGKILGAARKIVNADAGTIYIKQGNSLKFSHTQNETLRKRLSPGKKLLQKTSSIPITHNSISGYVASTGKTVNISDVYWLNTDRVPYAFDRSFDKKTHYLTQSMLTLPLRNNHNQVTGVMQLINAHNDDGEVIPFFENDIPLIEIFADNAVMALERAQTTRSEILGLIRFLTKLRDPEETEGHVNRIGAYSVEIYERWAHTKGIPWGKIEANIDVLRMAAMLHDIGKLAIPNTIREKPAQFTAKEYAVMKQHTVKGAKMLLNSAKSTYEEVAAEIALNHHEYWDGSGYPGHVNIETGLPISSNGNGKGKARGKKGTEIPVYGRIVAIADTYDALLHRRVFRKAMRPDDVLKIIKRGAGIRFDPEMVDAFFSCLDTIQAIGQRFPETN